MEHNVKQRYVAGLKAAQSDVRLDVRESRAEHVRAVYVALLNGENQH